MASLARCRPSGVFLLLLLIAGSARGWIARGPLGTRRRLARACRSTAAATDDALGAAREALRDLPAKELRRQLTDRGVGWEDLFEKSELVERLATLVAAGDGANGAQTDESASAESAQTDAAQADPPAAPQDTPPSPSSSPPAAGDADALERARAEIASLRVSELRQRLAERNVGWADLFEKSELVERLAGLLAADLRFCPSGRVPLGRVAELDEAAARLELADATTPLLLDVYAKWCGPCQLMAPAFAQVAAEMSGRVRFVKVDSDAAAALSSELRVQGLPTLIAFRDGKAVQRAEGALSAQAIRQLCEEHLLG